MRRSGASLSPCSRRGTSTPTCWWRRSPSSCMVSGEERVPPRLRLRRWRSRTARRCRAWSLWSSRSIATPPSSRRRAPSSALWAPSSWPWPSGCPTSCSRTSRSCCPFSMWTATRSGTPSLRASASSSLRRAGHCRAVLAATALGVTAVRLEPAAVPPTGPLPEVMLEASPIMAVQDLVIREAAWGPHRLASPWPERPRKTF
mmetsp:Transcript_67830/g.219165  ORF Transcript_67830/g.219165 Transcript_67830/m.219165 type:complete len:202 (+) Transcript_67830:867-1472(+)